MSISDTIQIHKQEVREYNKTGSKMRSLSGSGHRPADWLIFRFKLIQKGAAQSEFYTVKCCQLEEQASY